MLRLAMKDSSFRMTRGKDGKNIGYSDNDRGGFGSGNANKFVPEFVEYKSPAGSAKNPYLHPSAPPKDPTIVAVPPGKQIGNPYFISISSKSTYAYGRRSRKSGTIGCDSTCRRSSRKRKFSLIRPSSSHAKGNAKSIWKIVCRWKGRRETKN